MSGATDAKAELHRDVGAYGLNPLGYVRFAFPWGVPGTPLATDGGPEDWQCEVLQQLGQGLASLAEAVRLAVASGHGVGKSAFVFMLWALDLHDSAAWSRQHRAAADHQDQARARQVASLAITATGSHATMTIASALPGQDAPGGSTSHMV